MGVTVDRAVGRMVCVGIRASCGQRYEGEDGKGDATSEEHSGCCVDAGLDGNGLRVPQARRMECRVVV